MPATSAIRSRRLECGLTQAAVADRSGLDIRTIRRAETGEADPRSTTLILLAAALRCRPGDLRGGNDA